MTDEQISEIFAMGRESFFAGQQSFQVQAYPFRMTPANMAKHRNNPNMPFWKMLKQGYDHFEVTRLEPKVDVCEKRYVFNAQAPANASAPLSFNPKGKCPAYEIPQDVWAAVNEKQRRDELQVAELVSRGTPVAPVKSGRDGGMHPTFVAKLQPREVIDENGNVKLVVDGNAATGAIAYSPAQPADSPVYITAAAAEPIQVADVPLPRSAPLPKQGARPEEPSFMQRLGSLFRVPASDTSAQSRVAAAQPAQQASPQPRPAPRQTSTGQTMGLRGSETAASEAAPAPRSRPIAAGAPAPKPGAIQPQPDDTVKTAETATPAAAASTTGSVMRGAQPIPATSSFESRWSAFR
jgi:hypothetical protein